MVTPKWVKTLAQPIGVDDVIAYLDASKNIPMDKNIIIDIGSQKMTYKQMMLSCAKALGLRRCILPLPILTIKLSSYWLNFFTPVPYTVARSLIEGLSSEVIVQNDNAQKHFPHIKPIDFESAVKKAIEQMEDNQVLSRWSDAGGVYDLWQTQHKNDPSTAVLIDRQKLNIDTISKGLVWV